MSYVEGTTGAMLQGVSEQPPRLRAEGQVTEQQNYDSEVSTGITARPGTEEIAALVGTTQAMEFQWLRLEGDRFIIGVDETAIGLWDQDGTVYTVSTPDGIDYLSEDMVMLPDTQEKHIKLLNRDKVVRMDPTVTGRPFHAALAVCLGGVFDRTYSVEVTASNGDSLRVAFDTPDGTASGDGTKTAAPYIMEQLKTAWDAETLPAGLTGITLEQSEGVLVWTHTSEITVSVDDSDSGDTMRGADSSVEDTTHLPATAKHGHIVKVRGTASKDDDYFLRFESDVTTVDGEGFGSPGVWREAADPDIPNSIDPATMIHRLTVDTVAKTAVFQQIEWQPRRVGDADSNKDPAFVDQPIRDMTLFEDRLAIVAGSTFITTRSKETDDFWKRSAVTDNDADPISVRSTASTGNSLDWIVPFDRNLLLVADYGNAQFIVRGGGLTPDNASMVLTTNYTVASGVRPISTGRTIILPFQNGRYTGLNEFFTQDEAAVNAADPLTAVQPSLLDGDVRSMASAPNFSRFSVATRLRPRTLQVYKYLWDGNERLQSAWYRVLFSDRIRAHHYDEDYMYVIFRPDGDNAGAVLVRMDLNRELDDVGYHIVMDRKLTMTVGAGGTITVPYTDATVVQSDGCASPGLLGLVMTRTPGTGDEEILTLDTDMCPAGATVVVGQRVRRRLKPTMPQPRNRDGTVTSSASINIRHFMIHMSDSPDIEVTLESPYREDRSFYPRVVPEDNDPLDPQRLGKRDYVLKAPWRERHDRAELSVTCDDPRPDTILEIEWGGDIRGVRRRI